MWTFPDGDFAVPVQIEMTTGDAVAKGIIDNQTLAYYVARTQLFLLSVGIRAEGLRFRQHLSTEMAHYACDCWDAEILMSSGWVECVGHADRACYDLKVHSKKSKVELVAAHKFAEPQEMEVAAPTMNKGLMGRQFKKENSVVQEALAEVRYHRQRRHPVRHVAQLEVAV